MKTQSIILMRRTLVVVLTAGLFVFSTCALAQTAANACDLAQPYGTIDKADVDSAINMTLGLSSCTANIAGTGGCNVVMVQRVINASLPGGVCRVDGIVPRFVELRWTASSSTGVSGYNIYRGTTPGGPYTKVNPSLTVTSSYTDSVPPGQTYYYVTTAVGSSGSESSYSNEAKAIVPSL